MESISVLLLHNEVVLCNNSLLLLIYIVHHAEDVKFLYTYVCIYIYICRFFHYIKTIQIITIRIKGKKTIEVRRKICKIKYIVKIENKTQL